MIFVLCLCKLTTRVAQSVNALDFNRLVSERTIEIQLPLQAALRESQEICSLFNASASVDQNSTIWYWLHLKLGSKMVYLWRHRSRLHKSCS